SGGTINGNMTVNPGMQLTMSPATDTYIKISNGTLTNNGSINFIRGQLQLTSASIINNGFFNILGAQRIDTPNSQNDQRATVVENKPGAEFVVENDFNLIAPFRNSGYTSINDCTFALGAGGDLGQTILFLGSNGVLNLSVTANYPNQTSNIVIDYILESNLDL